jgi:hypothetical protein
VSTLRALQHQHSLHPLLHLPQDQYHINMISYTAAHANPQGAGDARPTALQIVRDEGLEGKLTGKVMVITGATSGIGLETARALAATGATLFLPVRDMEKAKNVLSGILDPGRVSLVAIDIASFASIGSAAATILTESNNQVNILVNNAGVMEIEDLRLTRTAMRYISVQTISGTFSCSSFLSRPCLLVRLPISIRESL